MCLKPYLFYQYQQVLLTSKVLLPKGTWVLLPPEAQSDSLQMEHSLSCSSGYGKDKNSRSVKKVQEGSQIVRTFTYDLNSGLSCAITLFHHGVTTLVSPVAIFPVGTPNTLKKMHHF